MHSDSLETTIKDRVTEVAKTVIGMIPYGGSIIATVVSEIIPNQRIDRIAKYVKELEYKISLIPIDRINKIFANEEFIDLLEESFIVASRSLSDERRQYIASIVTNGISNDEVKLHESKHLLKMLHELNDIEIIWLQYYNVQYSDDEALLMLKHDKILTPIKLQHGDNDEVLREVAITNSYIDHLHRLNLLADIKRQSKPLSTPSMYNRKLGNTHINNSTITALGKMLLYEIGLIRELK